VPSATTRNSATRPALVPAPRSLAIYVISLIAVFGISFGIGYIYQYDPQRDLLELVIDRSAELPRDSNLISGTVREVSETAVTVETESGMLQVPLAGITLEALLPLEYPSTVAIGSTVNLGGERTSTERVITGLVFFDGEVQP
jgi:hypothetical protein